MWFLGEQQDGRRAISHFGGDAAIQRPELVRHVATDRARGAQQVLVHAGFALAQVHAIHQGLGEGERVTPDVPVNRGLGNRRLDARCDVEAPPQSPDLRVGDGDRDRQIGDRGIGGHRDPDA